MGVASQSNNNFAFLHNYYSRLFSIGSKIVSAKSPIFCSRLVTPIRHSLLCKLAGLLNDVGGRDEDFIS